MRVTASRVLLGCLVVPGLLGAQVRRGADGDSASTLGLEQGFLTFETPTLRLELVRALLIDPRAEAEIAETSRRRIGIRTLDMGNSILSLSGGNQQKALFARALASKADIVLMDDPMRGVDVGTKQEVYGILRAEAARGRTFVWYTTEMDELAHCDHVYVFRNGRIVADLPRSELSEEKVLHASFEDEAA